jgi:uncharacterized protein YqhQ
MNNYTLLPGIDAGAYHVKTYIFNTDNHAVIDLLQIQVPGRMLRYCNTDEPILAGYQLVAGIRAAQLKTRKKVENIFYTCI